MLDLISVGTISIDLSFRGQSLTSDKDHFQLAVGGKYVVDELHEGIGGGGANVALGLREYGMDVAVLGLIGENSFKEIILEKLQVAGVHTHLCQVKKDYLNISSILLTPSGERSIIHYEPPHEELLAGMKDFSLLEQTAAVYLGNLPDVHLSQRTQLLMVAKHNGALTFLNLGVKDVRREQKELLPLIEQADVLIVNGHEYADLIKKKYEELDFKTNIVGNEKFLEGKIVIVTDGEKGSYGYFNSEVYFQEAIKPEKILDTTGAGDVYTAGFIAQYLRSKDVKKSMLQGAEHASKVLAQVGAN